MQAAEFATVDPCPNGHHYVVFDLGDDEGGNPNSNEEALSAVASEGIALRSFRRSSEEENGSGALYEGHLAAISDQDERVRFDLFHFCKTIIELAGSWKSRGLAFYIERLFEDGLHLFKNIKYVQYFRILCCF